MRPQQSGRTGRVDAYGDHVGDLRGDPYDGTDADAALTAVVPRIAPAGRRPGRTRAFLPWLGVGLLAAVVLTGTTIWSAALRPAAAPAVPTLATEAAPTAVPSARADGTPTQTPAAAAETRPPRAPVRDAPDRPPARTTVPAPTTAATTVSTVSSTPTSTRSPNPFGLGNEASCADPGAASRPECQEESLDGTEG